MANTKFSNDIDSITMLNNITNGLNFNIPDVDLDSAAYSIPPELLAKLSADQDPITIGDLTEPQVGGSKTFDRMMYAFSLHLSEEMKAGRIIGADYVNAYTQFGSVAMQCAVTFELGRRKQMWDGILAQIQAIKANVELAIAKVQLAIAKAQAHNAKAQYANTVANLAVADANYQLVQQQIDSYQAHDRKEAADLQINAWVTQKGVDEGILAPSNLQNPAIDTSLNHIYSKLGMK